MAELVVVKGDPVTGKDKHKVTGQGPNPAAPPPTALYKGTGEFQYTGSVTGDLSDFVSIDGTPVALVTSQSSLDARQTAPSGGHVGKAGSAFVMGEGSVALTPNLDELLKIDDTPLGKGVPASSAGSGLLTVNGVKVLLDGDKIDTCGPSPTTEASKVTVQGQDFVTCSE